MRVTQMLRHAAAVTAAHIRARLGNAHIGCVALGCVGDIAHRLRQRYLRLRPADKIGSLRRSVGYHQRLRVRQAYILCRTDNNATRHKAHVLTALNHARQVMQRCIRIAAAHALDKGTDDVVMLVALFIVTLQRRTDNAAQRCHRQHTLALLRQHELSLLQNIQRTAGITCCKIGNNPQRLRLCLKAVAKTTLSVGNRSLQNLLNLRCLQLFQTHHLHTRKQWRIDFEERVFGSSTDEHYRAVFHVREQHILLRLVEAMNLVDKHDSTAASVASVLLRLGDELAQLGDTAGNGVNGLKLFAGDMRDDLRQRCFACSRRSVKEYGLQYITLNHTAQRTACAHSALLPYKVAEAFGTHAVSQRLRLSLFSFK